MSGGSYNYAFRTVEDFAAEMRSNGGCGDYSSSVHRELFRGLLVKVADAMRAIEWNDSCDGDAAERAKIIACLEYRPDRRAEEVLREKVAALEDVVKSVRGMLDAGWKP